MAPAPTSTRATDTAPLGRHIVLVGPMASGKTTLGRLVASIVGRRFIDSDEELERAFGRNAEAMLASHGRDELHAAERDVLLAALRSNELSVVAAAASVVDDDQCRAVLRTHATVIALVATADTRARRIAEGDRRPIDGPIPDVVARLDVGRYAPTDSIVEAWFETDHDSPAATADAIVASLRRRVTVELGPRSYDVVIGPGVRLGAAAALPPGVRRAAVVTQPGIGVEVQLGVETEVFEIPSGEGAKSLLTIEQLCRSFSRFGLTRSDVIVAVGGGVVTDTAGFAAASYHRGTPLMNVPTTLLGQIDAAIGGKTGVNLPEGKNLVGAFWQPCAVLCDTDTLETMPDRERRSGLGEMAKYAFLGVENLDELPIVDRVAACVAAKATVVAADEHEGDSRMTLNYGHTLAHTLEAAGFADGPGRDGIDLRHGEAVAIGLVFAARLARVLGRIDDPRVRRHIDLVASYGLPTELPAGIEVDEIVALMARDKKARAGITFVLDGAGGVEVVDDVAAETISEVLRAGLGVAPRTGVPS